MSGENTERKPFPKKALATYSVPEIIDYLIDRVGSDRITKIGEKAKSDYDRMIEKMSVEDAKACIEKASVLFVENKLKAMK